MTATAIPQDCWSSLALLALLALLAKLILQGLLGLLGIRGLPRLIGLLRLGLQRLPGLLGSVQLAQRLESLWCDPGFSSFPAGFGGLLKA